MLISFITSSRMKKGRSLHDRLIWPFMKSTWTLTRFDTLIRIILSYNIPFKNNFPVQIPYLLLNPAGTILNQRLNVWMTSWSWRHMFSYGFIVLMLLRVDNIFKSSEEFCKSKFGVGAIFTIRGENFDKLSFLFLLKTIFFPHRVY